MNIKLYSEKWGDLPLGGCSNTEKKSLFPGAEIKKAQSDLKDYCYLFQQFETRLFTIRYCCFLSGEKDSITVITDTPAVTFHFGVDYMHSLFTKHLGKQVFHERHWNCFYEPDHMVNYSIEASQTFISLDILIKEEYCNYLNVFCPVMNSLIENWENETAGKLTVHNHVAPIDAWTWQEELETWCFDKNRIHSDGDIIIHRLIDKSILNIKSEPEKRGITLTSKDIKKIYDASEMILGSDEDLTLKTLAAKLKLSTNRLDAGFKEIFGHSVSKHRLEDTMLKALRLINCKDASTEKVAAILGYSNPHQFSMDFRKRFGYTPLEND
jgi:AraC-like DNA-binding protein